MLGERSGKTDVRAPVDGRDSAALPSAPRPVPLVPTATPSPTPPTAAMSCSCRPATTSSAARSPSPRASSRWLLLPPGALDRLAPARLPLFRLPDARAAVRQPRLVRRLLAILVAAGLFGSRDPLVQPAAADRLDAALGRPDPGAGRARQSLVVDQPLVRAVPGSPGARLGAAADAAAAADGSAAGRRVILFVGFAWFELIDPAPDDPGAACRGRRRLLRCSASPRCSSSAIATGRRRGEFLSVFFAHGFPLRRPAASPATTAAAALSPRPARRRARRRSAACRPAASLFLLLGAVVGVVRRPVEHLLLARPDRRQPARISRPLRGDRHQQRRPVRRPSSRCSRRLPARGLHRRAADRARAARSARRPASMSGRSCRSRSPITSRTT